MGIIIKPIVTEKMTGLGEKFSRYGFRVSQDANKLEIKKAISEMYNVTVVSVNTMNVEGKNKSRYTKAGVINGKKPSYKKAFVTLKEGDVIDFYSNI
ncbi:MAG: 50S ribosomal protein L23 [Paludibacteraceae bacterium]|jgi:large subunit ribosomal protein L23|nr:50S ribosomal protein L23 [Paludibacteraceae bacterium]HOI26224.1 50S ribosomal protein L23 [Paludibacteraceae bacterium]HOU67716.1 50S ribosomal protein L23 [Paludibacteraceae bacterium]HPH63171.1 50S ribosomal protein L23 [Paludibacteraceae bacterium]HQF49723.1 50S ribosomal protein L23 [Paludibacteraceae bacterium]